MRFGDCPECNKYKYLKEDTGICPTCEENGKADMEDLLDRAKIDVEEIIEELEKENA